MAKKTIELKPFTLVVKVTKAIILARWRSRFDPMTCPVARATRLALQKVVKRQPVFRGLRPEVTDRVTLVGRDYGTVITSEFSAREKKAYSLMLNAGDYQKAEIKGFTLRLKFV